MKMEPFGLFGYFGGLLLICGGLWVMRYTGGSAETTIILAGLLFAMMGMGSALQAAITWRDGALGAFGGALAAGGLLALVVNTTFTTIPSIDPDTVRQGAIYATTILLVIMAVQTVVEALKVVRR